MSRNTIIGIIIAIIVILLIWWWWGSANEPVATDTAPVVEEPAEAPAAN